MSGLRVIGSIAIAHTYGFRDVGWANVAAIIGFRTAGNSEDRTGTIMPVTGNDRAIKR
jgi:hypothetical protein